MRGCRFRNHRRQQWCTTMTAQRVRSRNPEAGKFERVSKSDQDDLEFRLKKTADEIKALQDKYALSDEDELAAIRAEAAKQPMAGPDENQSPSSPTPTPNEPIDSCLVGTW